jgi:hypothetical protein
MMKYKFYILLFIITTSCGISEDCFKGSGNKISQSFPLEGFTKVKVHEGVGLIIKEGPSYEVRIETSDNIIDNIEINLEGEQLVVKDRSTCNIARDYGQTTVYVTVPDGTLLPIIPELELHCKTEQKIQSEGILHSPIVRLFSLDDSDGAGTGDFRLDLQTEQLFIESNSVSNFYLSGQSQNLHVFFWWGNGIFYGDHMNANTINFYHRGSNDMIFYPIQQIEGALYSTGNVRLTNRPFTINVIEYFIGRLIY